MPLSSKSPLASSRDAAPRGGQFFERLIDTADDFETGATAYVNRSSGGLVGAKLAANFHHRGLDVVQASQRHPDAG
jgi:hypothetical protein